jgi:tRNA (mo5U34)-methyltransferase
MPRAVEHELFRLLSKHLLGGVYIDTLGHMCMARGGWVNSVRLARRHTSGDIHHTRFFLKQVTMRNGSSTRVTPLAPEQIQWRVRQLGKWFHNLDLCGIKTAPDHFLGDYPAVKWRRFADAIPADLRGKSVLDIGCNGGFYAIEMKRRGADRVVGIDEDAMYLAQARFAAEVTGVDIELWQLSVYDVAKLGEQFDLVLFMGVLYHLRYPLLALDLIHEHVAKHLLVFQSMHRGSDKLEPVANDYPFEDEEIFNRPSFPRLHFIEQKYAGDPTNWWIPNRSCSEALLRSSGFTIISHPEQEVYICRRELRDAPHAVYPAWKEGGTRGGKS